MPITQDRVLALLAEYEQFINAHNHFIACLNRVLNGSFEPSDQVELLRNELLAIQHVPTTLAIVERRHFNSHARRNVRMRLKAERQRRARGVPTMEDRALAEADSYRFLNRDSAHSTNEGIERLRAYDAQLRREGQPILPMSTTVDVAQYTATQQSTRVVADAARDAALARAGASVGIAFDTPDDDSDIVDVATDL